MFICGTSRSLMLPCGAMRKGALTDISHYWRVRHGWLLLDHGRVLWRRRLPLHFWVAWEIVDRGEHL